MLKAISKLAIYLDEGVDAYSLRAAQFFFTKLCRNQQSVSTVSSADIIENRLRGQVFVMPGGADLPYLSRLSGLGNKNIRNFVQGGGKYVGICAGGYYACSSIVFAQGTSMEVVGDRELGFFPGRCIGPINGNFFSGSYGTAIIAKVKLTQSKNVYDMYVNGGGYFDYNIPPSKDCTTIATIEVHNKEVPIIVWCRYGKGAAILSGAHFEYGATLLSESDEEDIHSRRLVTSDMRDKEESLRKEIDLLLREI